MCIYTKGTWPINQARKKLKFQLRKDKKPVPLADQELILFALLWLNLCWWESPVKKHEHVPYWTQNMHTWWLMFSRSCAVDDPPLSSSIVLPAPPPIRQAIRFFISSFSRNTGNIFKPTSHVWEKQCRNRTVSLKFIYFSSASSHQKRIYDWQHWCITQHQILLDLALNWQRYWWQDKLFITTPGRSLKEPAHKVGNLHKLCGHEQ